LAHVSARTVRRRMSDPVFAADVSSRRAEHTAPLTGQLVTAGQGAVTVLLGCLGAESEAVRLRAAQLILALGTQMRHAGELEDRIGRGGVADRWSRRSGDGMISEDRLRQVESRLPATAVTPVTLVVPHVLEFALAPEYLNVRLFARQGTMLKVICCAPELFTDFAAW
jgi:hypothetical protein